MTIIAGNALDPKRFFQIGQPPVQGSSFDLTVGSIFDQKGKKVKGPFRLRPGHMVQVVSFESFNLPDCITGHVTYKTTLTKKGIWALTVGIVDPGWKGPVATTLLNFSKVDHAISEGDPFLRVSMFEHEAVPADRLRKSPSLEEYVKDIQKTATTLFPKTFLDTEDITEEAGKNVLNRIRSEALVWVAAIALLFTLLQAIRPINSMGTSERVSTAQEIDSLRKELGTLQLKLQAIEQSARQEHAPSTPISPNSLPSKKQ